MAQINLPDGHLDCPDGYLLQPRHHLAERKETSENQPDKKTKEHHHKS